MTRSRVVISNDVFVQAYQVSDSNAQVASRLGLSPTSVSIRASLLRRLGVNLKRFTGTRAGRSRGLPIDIAALNHTAATALASSQAETPALAEPAAPATTAEVEPVAVATEAVAPSA